MRHSKLRVLPCLTLLATVLATPAYGQQPKSKPAAKPTPTVKPAAIEVQDFAWLAGHWRGTGLGGVCEELWSPPLGGSMMGVFRLIRDNKVVFYEILVIHKDTSGVAMKVKHFSKDFVAWETKADHVRFAAESVTKTSAKFRGLTFDRSGDTLSIKLRMRGRDGKARWQPFEMKRCAPSAGAKAKK